MEYQFVIKEVKNLWNSFKIAFSMYSKIPMPYTKWNKKNMKYAICFFPMIGVAIGALIYLWSVLCSYFNIGIILKSAGYVVIPIFVTGGIHIDGFIDTMDALNSYQSKERKLEILKDPHIGAFALISAIAYFIVAFGLWSEINEDFIILISIGFILSRALSGYSLVTIKCAKDSGLAATFSDAAHKKIVKITMIFYIILCSMLMIIINYKIALIILLFISILFILYKKISINNFGGITGDLAGFFLQICELTIVFSIVLFIYLMR